MNNKLIKLLAASAVASSPLLNAEIVLTPELSVSGYMDVAVEGNDFDGEGVDNAYQYSSFELDFNFTTEPVSAVFEIQYDDDSDGNSDYELENVYFTFAFNENLSMSAGKILSYLGFESVDATGLYQYSYSYDAYEAGIPGYAEGISLDYSADWGSLGAWLGENGDEASYELAGSLTVVEGLTLFAAYANDPAYITFNTFVSYEIDAFTFAIEYVATQDADGYDVESYLAMANYAMGDMAITARVSYQDGVDFVYDDDDNMISATDGEFYKYTLSPSYTFTDNFLALVEVSYLDFEDDEDGMVGAIEGIYTF